MFAASPEGAAVDEASEPKLLAANEGVRSSFGAQAWGIHASAVDESVTPSTASSSASEASTSLPLKRPRTCSASWSPPFRAAVSESNETGACASACLSRASKGEDGREGPEGPDCPEATAPAREAFKRLPTALADPESGMRLKRAEVVFMGDGSQSCRGQCLESMRESERCSGGTQGEQGARASRCCTLCPFIVVALLQLSLGQLSLLRTALEEFFDGGHANFLLQQLLLGSFDEA